MSRHCGRLACFASWLGLLGFASPVVADTAPVAPQDELDASPSVQARGSQATAGDDSDGEQALERFNELALVLAGTREEEETFFTVGLEYERRIIAPLGVGGIVEYLGGEDSWVFVFPVFWHPYKGLKLIVGPGFEHEDGGNDALVRLGAMYSLEIRERYSITPFVEVDFIGREGAVIFGSSFGLSF